ncbi:putative dolichyl-diphosphooligosaccharide--protein glycosyltransferase subunit 3B [Apium graveolens]|uniref:putative dolichyl-diphosphooligosaccharide--protein glycosyltransferase subunit 3B n=1 Tax=Apium graveolens TaxID=4045 RepID=UPI003D7AF305
MAITNPPPLLHFLLISLLISLSHSSSDPLSELKSLRSTSDSSTIHLSDSLFRRILSHHPRTFSLLVFFDATQLHNKPELQLQSLKSEFKLVSKSFFENNQNNPDALSKLFFGVIEFGESQSTFAQFGVNSLPHIRLVGPTDKDMKSEPVKMDAGDYSRLADSMAEFVESRTNVVVGDIVRPPIVSRKQMGVIVLGVLIMLPFLIKRVIVGDTMLHDWKVWLAGAVFVYFFSVSGAMFNIIRKMPMVIPDRNDPNKLVFFYQGSGMQLGAEGFTIGFLYTIVGLLLALMTHVLVRVRSVNAQRLVMIVALFVSFLAVNRVVLLDNWKTGYGIHGYWPSSWN